MTAALAEVTAHLPANEARRRGRGHCLSVERVGMGTVSEECGLSADDARSGVAWAIKTLVAELRREITDAEATPSQQPREDSQDRNRDRRIRYAGTNGARRSASGEVDACWFFDSLVVVRTDESARRRALDPRAPAGTAGARPHPRAGPRPELQPSAPPPWDETRWRGRQVSCTRGR